jgi:hypothetical protein
MRSSSTRLADPWVQRNRNCSRQMGFARRRTEKHSASHWWTIVSSGMELLGLEQCENSRLGIPLEQAILSSLENRTCNVSITKIKRELIRIAIRIRSPLKRGSSNREWWTPNLEKEGGVLGGKDPLKLEIPNKRDRRFPNRKAFK